MINKTRELFEGTIEELRKKFNETGGSEYDHVCNQIEFVYDCIINNKDIKKELGGRKLNFTVVASRNFSGPEEYLNEKVGEIGLITGRL